MMVKQLAVAIVICVFATSGRAEYNRMFAPIYRLTQVDGRDVTIAGARTDVWEDSGNIVCRA
jgi:hypothetical protein